MRAFRGMVLGITVLLAACAKGPGTASSSPEVDGRDRLSQAAGAGASGSSLRVVVLSDMNGSYGATSYGDAVHGAVGRVVDLAPDLVISTGDMVAGQKEGLDHRAMWTAFHSAVTLPLESAGIPFAPTPGNHDASGYDRFAQERAIYVDEWRAHRPQVEFLDGSDYPLRYSFVAGPALFISLDATTLGPFSAETHEWVSRQLAAGADRPVKIVYGHVPLHPFAIGREREVTADAELEEILVAHDVSLFISGHHHAYYPGRHGALRVVSTSCLGDGPRALIGTTEPSVRSLLLIDIDDGAVSSLEAYPEADWTIPIPRASLPESLRHGGVTVIRDDL